MEKGEEDFGKISKAIQKEMARFEVRNKKSLEMESDTLKKSVQFPGVTFNCWELNVISFVAMLTK